MNRHEKRFEILRTPLVTEKSTGFGDGEALNKVVFQIAPTATKADVKDAVETLFKVKVQSVNSLWRKGKTKQFRGRPGKRPNTKRAIVTLAPGQSIDALSLTQNK